MAPSAPPPPAGLNALEKKALAYAGNRTLILEFSGSQLTPSAIYMITTYLNSMFVEYNANLKLQMLKPGLWCQYTKLPTPSPRFLKLRFRLRHRLLHKSSICINNGKPIRYFITTM
jgi:hypothetical protein